MEISNAVVCGFATISTTATYPQWASISPGIPSSPSQSTPSFAKSPTTSLTRSLKSSARGLVSSDRQDVFTSTSHTYTESISASSLSPTVFSSSTRQSPPNTRSSKVSRLGEASQGSKKSASFKRLSASTTNQDSLSVSSAADGTSSETIASFISSYSSHSQPVASNQSCSLCMESSVSTAARSSSSNTASSEMIATFTPSFSHSSSHSTPTVLSQSCSLCSQSSLLTASSSYSSPRTRIRPDSMFRSSVSQTTSNSPRSSMASGAAVSVSSTAMVSAFSASSTPVVSAFYEVLSGGVTSYYNITATITSPPPG